MKPLTEQQVRDVSLVLAAGCDRETAAHFVGCTVEELHRHAQQEPGVEAAMRRAVAGCELSHVRSLQQASRDPRYWRASAWMLERLAPQRYGVRQSDRFSRDEVAQLLAAVSQSIAEVLADEKQRQALLDRIRAVSDKLYKFDVKRLASEPTPEDSA